MNWYVIQVRSGHEKEIADKCKFLIDSTILKDCFIPEYYVQKKFQGAWHQVKQILFKGYVFLISDSIDGLYNELKKIPDFTKVIGKKKEEIYPLKEEEVNFLVSFSKDDHIVEMSVGYIEGQVIYVTKGPLKGKEGMITKIDRHKRMAYIQVNLFNEIRTVKVGLEIINKC